MTTSPSRFSFARLFSARYPFPGTIALFLVAALFLVGCDSTGTAPATTDARVSLAFSASSPASPSGTNAKSLSLGDNDGNTLVFDRVELIISEIEFEREDDAECDDGRDEYGDDDACEEVESGPMLVDLPLDGQAPVILIETNLAPGTWEEVEFEIDALDRDDDDERTFLDETGFPEDVSIRALGTFAASGGDAVPFTYVTDLDVENEIEFEPPLTIRDGDDATVTFSVDIGTWFRSSDGYLIDPNQAGDDDPFEDDVEENIENSFDGFEDDNRDGRRDDDGDDGRDGDDDGDDGRDDDDDDGDDDDGDDDNDDDDDEDDEDDDDDDD